MIDSSSRSLGVVGFLVDPGGLRGGAPPAKEQRAALLSNSRVAAIQIRRVGDTSKQFPDHARLRGVYASQRRWQRCPSILGMAVGSRSRDGTAAMIDRRRMEEFMMKKAMVKRDAELQEEVRQELGWDTRVEASDVGVAVAVDSGIVRLTGTVKSYPEKLAAQE